MRAARRPARTPRTPDPPRQRSAERPAGTRPTTTRPTRRPTQRRTTRSRPRPPRRRTPARTPGDASDTRQRPGQTRPATATRARPEAQPANHGKPPETETKPETEPRHTPNTAPGKPAGDRSDAPHSAPATAWRPEQRGDAGGGRAEAGAGMRPTAKRGHGKPAPPCARQAPRHTTAAVRALGARSLNRVVGIRASGGESISGCVGVVRVCPGSSRLPRSPTPAGKQHPKR